MKKLNIRGKHISNVDASGIFIYVRQIYEEIFVIFLPNEQEIAKTTIVYVIALNNSMFVNDITEIRLPLCQDIHIAKIYQDVKANPIDFVVTGSFVAIDAEGGSASARTELKIRNYVEIQLSPSKKRVAGIVYDFVLDDVYIESISKQGKFIHSVGFRRSAKESVYIQYDNETKKINQEIAFFSDEGFILLQELYCNSDNDVIVVGHIQAENRNIAYINRFMATVVGSTPM